MVKEPSVDDVSGSGCNRIGSYGSSHGGFSSRENLSFDMSQLYSISNTSTNATHPPAGNNLVSKSTDPTEC